MVICTAGLQVHSLKNEIFFSQIYDIANLSHTLFMQMQSRNIFSVYILSGAAWVLYPVEAHFAAEGVTPVVTNFFGLYLGKGVI